MKQRTVEKAIYAAISKYFFRVAALRLIFTIAIIYGLAQGANYLIFNPLNLETKDPFNNQFVNK